jgi:hypothetical protein
MTKSRMATVQVFLTAFRGLTKAQRQEFLQELLRQQTYREDLLDVATIEARRHEPSRPLRDYLAQRSRKS